MNRPGTVVRAADNADSFLTAILQPLRIVLLLFWGASASLAAPPTFRGDATYLIDTWETEDGLPENSATSMVQSSDGYLWFGTFNGLVRFDGVKFTVFNPANTPQLPNESIVNLHLDSRGWLWVSTDGGLVVRQKDDRPGTGFRWRSFGTADGWVGDYVRGFAERSNGDLLLTTFDGHVLEFSNDRLRQLPPPGGRSGIGYLPQADEAGRWWVAQQWFVGSWDGERWEPASVTNLFSLVNGSGAARDGGLWLLAGSELFKLRRGTVVARVALPEFPGHPWSITEDSAGNVWIATFDHGLCRVFPSGQLLRWTTTNGLSYDGTRFVFEDREQNLWVGTSGGGLQRFKPRRFQSFSLGSGLTERNVTSVWPDTTGGVWVATYGKGVFRWRDGMMAAEPLPPENFPLNYVHSVLTDHAGRTWIGTLGQGVCVVDQQGFRRLPYDQIGGFDVSSLFEDSHERVWIGGLKRLSFWEAGAVHLIPEEPDVSLAAVRCFAEDGAGVLWLATKDHLFRRDNDRFIEVRDENNTPIRNVTCLKTDTGGALWMDSFDVGLRRWMQGRWSEVSAEAGVPVRGIHGMLEDDRGFFWMASNRGVVRVRRQDLHALCDGLAARVECQLFDLSDGMPSVECAGGRQPVCARDSRGRLWFATLKGAAMIDPAEFRLNTNPPPVQIESLTYHAPARGAAPMTVGGLPPGQSPPTDNGPASSVAPAAAGGSETVIRLSAPFTAPVLLPAGSRSIEIHYTALHFTSPEKVRFQVRLEGQEAGWQDAGTQRIAYYHDLRPRQYSFRVRAANNDRVWNETGASLAFSVRPFLWQTGWFRLGLALMLVGTGGGTVLTWAWFRRRRELADLQRTHRQSAALVALSVHPAVTLGNLDAAFREISEQAARVLAVGRVGIWLFDEIRSELRCANLFNRLEKSHASGTVLALARYPRYFESLQRDRAIDATDARQDPRTSEFTADYLIPLRIASMLDAPVRVSGKLAGVICHEHLGTVRSWSADEVAFAGGVADQVARALLNAEREQVAGELRESERRMELAASAAELGLWVWDIHRDEIWMTDKGRALFNWGASERVNFDRFIETLHPEDREPTRQAVRRCLDGRGDYQTEYRVARADGATRWIAARGDIEFDSGGKPVRLRGVSIDITARRMAEDKFRLTVEASPSGIVLVNDQGRIVLVNAETEKLFGYTRGELIGQPVEMLVPERFHPAHPGYRAGFVAAPKARAMGAGRELFARRKNGMEFPVEIGLSPIESAEGILILTAIVDITARKEAEAEAQRQRAELAHVARVSTMGELAASVAHELNQPLGAILSNAEAAEIFLNQDPPLLDEVREILVDIRQDDERAGEVIRRMRALLRKREMEQQPLELNVLVEDVLGLVSADAALRKTAIHAELSPALPPVHGDRIHLQQVLLNLILNGMEAMTKQLPAKRKLLIRTSRSGLGAVEIAVTDSGHGIEPDKLPRLFEPFFTTKPNGMGMGLSIARTIVEAHHGRIGAENNPSGGATFRVVLPAITDH